MVALEDLGASVNTAVPPTVAAAQVRTKCALFPDVILSTTESSTAAIFGEGTHTGARWNDDADVTKSAIQCVCFILPNEGAILAISNA